MFEQAEYLRISAKHGLHLFLSPDQSNWLKNVRVLDYPKFRLALLEKQTLLEAFLPYAEAVSVKGVAGCPPCRDPHDVPFLALGHQGRADDLVTGDADLLAVTGGTPYAILAPDAFRAVADAWRIHLAIPLAIALRKTFSS